MTGSLHEKFGKWNMVLYGKYSTFYPDSQSENPNKKVYKWISTGLDATGRNKAAANKLMYETIIKYEELDEAIANNSFKASVNRPILFTDFIEDWLERKKNEIRQITLEGYEVYAKRHIIPYFSALGLTLNELKPKHILDYYQYKATNGRLDGKGGGLGTRSLRSHGQLIKAVLNDAVILEYIPRNPAMNVPVPKKPKTSETAAKNVYMTAKEANDMLSAISDEEIYPLVYTALYYGLRKSEVLGLKWSAIDYEKNTLEIKSTVVKHKSIVYQDDTKTENSHDTFSLLPEIKQLLEWVKAKQERNREEYGALYTDSDYVFVHPDGRLYRPDCVTKTFQRMLKRHGLPEMRFHDLRHSTASICFDKGWDIEAIKSWLRHADIETTSNIYLHISKQRKAILADNMQGTFNAPIFNSTEKSDNGGSAEKEKTSP